METLVLPLGDTFLYRYTTAAHYWTQIDVSAGLEEITHWIESDKAIPGGPVQHVRRLRASQLGRQYVLEWRAVPNGKLRERTRTLVVIVQAPEPIEQLQMFDSVHPLCHCCVQPAEMKCSRCQALYCNIQCQKDNWAAHSGLCIEPLIYSATGFLQGTTHRAEIAHGIFHSTGFSEKSTLLTKKQQVELSSALQNYWDAGAFHVKTERDQPRGGDMGVAVFIHRGLYADPRDVPRLAKLMLVLDPGLAESPGGLEAS